jgi:hypothetical protein
MRDKWRLAWRVVGNLVRIMLELRLHHHQVLLQTLPRLQERHLAINIIWTIIVLDRQLSYALGLSLALQESYLDPEFPGPVRLARACCPLFLRTVLILTDQCPLFNTHG